MEEFDPIVEFMKQPNSPYIVVGVVVAVVLIVQIIVRLIRRNR